MNQSSGNLILVADDDRLLCKGMATYLKAKGFETALAHDGTEALRAFRELKPRLVISDISMPAIGGLDFLMEARKLDPETPFIMVTGYPDMESVLKAIHNGAYDYVVKPFQMEALHQKITQALNTSRLTRENAALSSLASLHKIVSQLTETHELDELLDVTFQACLEVSRADGGSIHLVDTQANQLVTMRQRGTPELHSVSSLDDHDTWPAAKWVVENKSSLLIVGDQDTMPLAMAEFGDEPRKGSLMCIPIVGSGDVIGVVTVRRLPGGDPFSSVDLNTMEVLSSQAGTAINNANLYTSLRQRLAEISLVSTYSEKLMGLIDKVDVITCLFETIREHTSLDVLGYLVVKKRFHEFLYWSSGEIKNGILNSVVNETLEKYNNIGRPVVMAKRVRSKPLTLANETFTGSVVHLGFKHIVPLIWDEHNFGALYFGSRDQITNCQEVMSLIKTLVSQTRIALTNAGLYGDIKENYIRTIKALAIAVDAKDTYTHGHSENVMNIAEQIARELGVTEEIVGIIRDAGLLHDIGKIGIPGFILNKPGPLTNEEFNGIMKTHTTLGANIVRDVPFLSQLYTLILYHHENFDGTGYPEGLRGEGIPIGARILHVADAFEAMTSNRPYRNSLGKQEAVKRLRGERGRQFDPNVVEAFLRVAETKGWSKD